MTLGERIRQLRKSQNLSQQELGRLIGTTSATINRYEKSLRTPKLPVLHRLAEALQTDLDFLLGSKTSPSPSLAGGQWLPVNSRPPLGIPARIAEKVLSYEEISPQTARLGNYFVLQIQGQEMEPQLFDQDLLIVSTQEDCDNGDIAVVLVSNSQVSIRRIQKTAEGIILIPSNPTCPLIFYSNQEIQSLPIQILGKVIELRRKF